MDSQEGGQPAVSEAEAHKTGNAKWRARYRRRLREERGQIQVNVTVPEGAAPLIKELARRLKDGTWPEFVLQPWDDESARSLAAYRQARQQTETERASRARRTAGHASEQADTSQSNADSGPVCPVTVRFAVEPSAEEVALIEGPPFNLSRARHAGYTWTGHLRQLVAQRLRMKLDYRLSESKPVVTIHNPAARPHSTAAR